MIVFHHNDADGRCAAAIAAQWVERGMLHERLAFVEMDYKDRVPVEQIERTDTVAIVDFSLKPDDMDSVMAATDKAVIWCDHHVTAKDYCYNAFKLAGVRDFSNKGKSGCECAWEHFFPSDPVPLFVTLIGDYDAWRLSLAPACFEFYEGLKMLDQHPNASTWQLLFGDPTYTDVVQKMGRVAIRYRDNYCAEIRKAFGYETEIGGQKAIAMNAFRFGSKQFGESFSQYPVCIAYIHDGTKYTVSLYSETVDVGAIAKQYGGGGHKGAAGFVCEQLPFTKKGGA